MSCLGNINYFFFAAHLIDVAICFKTLGTILQSVTHNGKQVGVIFNSNVLIASNHLNLFQFCFPSATLISNTTLLDNPPRAACFTWFVSQDPGHIKLLGTLLPREEDRHV